MLLIVDGSNLWARAWHVCGQDMERLPKLVGSMLQAAVRRHGPAHVIVALDSPEPSFRHDLVTGYKGDRLDREGPGTRELTDALRPWLAAWGVATREADGYEADDVVATLVARARGLGAIRVLSKDTDLLQLVDDVADVAVLWPDKGADHLYREAEVLARCGVTPARLLDFRVMVGGKDNLPRIGWTPAEVEAAKAAAGGKLAAPFGFTEKRAAALLANLTLDHLLAGAVSQLTDRERLWLELRLRDAVQLRKALRLRTDLGGVLVANGARTNVKGHAWDAQPAAELAGVG